MGLAHAGAATYWEMDELTGSSRRRGGPGNSKFKLSITTCNIPAMNTRDESKIIM